MGEEKKKKLRLSDLKIEKQQVETSIGVLFVRHYTMRDLAFLSETLNGNGPERIGALTLQKLTSHDEKDFQHAGLSDQEFEQLNEHDYQVLLPAAFKCLGYQVPASEQNLEGLGRQVEEKMKGVLEATTKIADSIKSYFSSETLKGFEKSLDGLRDITTKIQGASTRWSAFPSDMHKEMIVETPKIPDLDALVRNSPDARAMRAAERTEKTLTEMSGMLLQMAGAIGDVSSQLISKVVPEFLNSLAGQKAAEKKAFILTIGGLAFSALVSIALTGWQVYLAKEAAKDADKQSRAVVAILTKQLDQSNAAQVALSAEFDALRRQNESLNLRLAQTMEVFAKNTHQRPASKISQKKQVEAQR
ncbi:hypothetical protein AVM47_006930 [Pseudomonas aeruginosa]|uniref:hypothetical protein n=1 Tax=Pseudomonas aeruginosa TaxID=287 RepID=UPI0005B85E85|nr:hypothetical protein [Pseudomonas aeruginosa]EIU3494739.1 hypothetical protein [Pseudomonas aeruginosa]KSN27790.1 hypothetical protein APA78_18490 [Pseudomonas aeruginosa]MBK1797650.1 hypothetical protein [Pseudomonas aeruginosa]HCF6759282.1 hypothetical protein [Pseudomonas aeruginosa]